MNGPRNVREVAPFFFPPGTADHRPRREVVRCPAPTGRPPPTTGGRSCPASGARSLAATTPGCRARPRRRETGETRRGPVPPRRPCCGRSLPVSTREVAARRRPQDGRRPPPARGASPPSTGGRRVAEDERPRPPPRDGRPPILGMRGRPSPDDSGRPPTRNEGRTPRRLFFREAARRPRRESPNAPPSLPGAGSPHVEGGRPNLAGSEPTLRGAGRLFPPVVWIPRRPSYLCQEATCRPRREATGSLWTEAASSPAS